MKTLLVAASLAVATVGAACTAHAQMYGPATTRQATTAGAVLGAIAGGLIYDSLASYTWLYLGSFGMGLGAFLIAMTFRPFPKGEAIPAAA